MIQPRDDFGPFIYGLAAGGAAIIGRWVWGRLGNQATFIRFVVAFGATIASFAAVIVVRRAL